MRPYINIKVLFFLCFVTRVVANTSHPNIVMIIADDLKPSIGAFGDEKAITPNMDKLAANGVVFLNNHCQQAVCGPSRNSVFTGQLPNRNGIWEFGQKLRKVRPNIVTLPQYFKQHGYHAASMGKVYDGRNTDGWSTQDKASWSEPHSWPKGKSVLGKYAGVEAKALVQRLKDEGKWEKSVDAGRQLRAHGFRPSTEAAEVKDTAYADAVIAQSAVNKIEQFASEDKPFFLAVGFSSPHLPFNAPTKYWDLYEREDFSVHTDQKRAKGSPEIAYHNMGELRSYSDIPNQGPIPKDKQAELAHGYYAATSFVDAQIGKVVDAIQTMDIADNTIIVLWGDHGYHLGDHGLWNKHTNFEQATRSPLIIVDPGLSSKDVVVKAPTELTDIYPTLCQLAGLPVPNEKLDGKSLVPLMENPQAPHRGVARSQYRRKKGGKPHMGYSIRSDRYRLTEWIQCEYMNGEFDGDSIAIELYDYQEDSNETINLAADPDQADRSTAMRQTLREAFGLSALEQ
ncbi:sulfatase [Rubellicoccus peritrichatus]|uniref:Sulfatase n=1 Tax=Rubellicoccus peritrichatus TaxID=3080537 RepID=A0AAQ3LFK2_9BACT|nr:sulfatase [Puniceicoccus sp. CR14]WOO41119.1 sulfatase [Puniceicoccus sp. CR14]